MEICFNLVSILAECRPGCFFFIPALKILHCLGLLWLNYYCYIYRIYTKIVMDACLVCIVQLCPFLQRCVTSTSATSLKHSWQSSQLTRRRTLWYEPWMTSFMSLQTEPGPSCKCLQIYIRLNLNYVFGPVCQHETCKQIQTDSTLFITSIVSCK